jgi:WD40 repeat protein
MTMSNEVQTFTYDVFISYSSSNKTFASEIQQALEAYRPEKALKVPQRFIKTFRDVKDIKPGDYHKILPEYLDASSKLMVICSPEARASKFVDEEIRHFAAVRGAENIIPVLLSGIPNNEAKPGQESDLAFPEELCRAMQMPLAVNYLNFDSKKDKINKGIFVDSWYSILADVYQLRRSEIEQREKRRRARIRRMRFAVLGSSLAVLSVLLIFAWVSRSQAITARNEAESAQASEKEQREIAETKRREAEEASNNEKIARGQAEEKRIEAEEAAKRERTARDEAEERRKQAELATENERIAKDQAKAQTIKANDALRTAYTENGRQELINDYPFRAAAYLSKAFQIPVENKNSGKISNLRFLFERSINSIGDEYFAISHDTKARIAEFSPDDTKILVASENKTSILDAETGELLTSLGSDSVLGGDSVSTFTTAPSNFEKFSPDSKRVVTADGITAHVWDVTTGKPILSLPVSGETSSAEFSPDGKKIVIVRYTEGEGEAEIWDAYTGVKLSTLKHFRIRSARFSPDSEKIVTTSDDRTSQVWAVKTGELLMTLKRDSQSEAQFSPDSKKVLGVTDSGGAKIWDAENGAVLFSVDNWSVDSANFSHHGDEVILGGDLGSQLWDINKNKMVISFEQTGAVLLAGFSPDDKKVFTIGTDNTVRVWEIESKELLASIQHVKPVKSVRFSNDGNKMITASDDGTARVWNTENHNFLPSFDIAGQVTSIAFSSDGWRAITLDSDGAKIWDLRTKKFLDSFDDPDAALAAFSADGKKIVITDHLSNSRIWDVSTKTNLKIITSPGPENPFNRPEQNPARLVTFSPDGNKLLVAGLSSCTLWDLPSGEVITTRRGGFNSVAFSPDGKYIVAAENNGAGITDLFDDRLDKIITTYKHEHFTNTAAFSPDGKKVVTASEDGSAKIWNAKTGRLLVSLEHQSIVSSAAFSPDNKRVVTTSYDKIVRVWDAETGKLLISFPYPAGSAQFFPDGQKIALFDRQGALKIWDLIHKTHTPAEMENIVEYKVPFHFVDGVLVPRQ